MMVLKDSLLVEEILQDTFIKAMEALNRTDIVGYTDQSNFCAWLVQIGHNLSVDYFRKNKRKKEYAMSNKDSDEAFHHIAGESRNPEQLITDIETDYDIQALIDQLHPDQKEVLVLYYFQGMKFKDIVDYIGGDISINTCLGRMRYALINLRKIIDQIKAEGQKVL